MASWRSEHRPEALQWLIEAEFFVKERDAEGTIVRRVTEAGREFVTPPSFDRIKATMETIGDFALPDDDDELQLVNWAINFYNRTGNWPTPWHYASSGLYQKDLQVFRDTLDSLVEQGVLVRIHIKRGRRNVTRLVFVAYCPQFAGKDGNIYFWSTTQGPFPEP